MTVGQTMSVAPLHAGKIHVQSGPWCLAAFDPLMAPRVVSWARDERELFWLAPKTVPPLTPAKVVAWPGPDGCPMLLYREQLTEPLGYIELNPMPGQKGNLWMGHCLIRPENRGAGLGRLTVELMLEKAFLNELARFVSLVVFPDNTTAIRCYRVTGFRHVGEQVKYFPTTRRQYCMLEMRITREEYLLIREKKTQA